MGYIPYEVLNELDNLDLPNVTKESLRKQLLEIIEKIGPTFKA